MNTCSQLCQHPTCWQSELESRKRFIQTGSERNDNKFHKFKERHIVQDSEDQLPTCKIVNLLETGDENFQFNVFKYPTNCNQRQTRLESATCFPICPNVSLNEHSSKFVERDWRKQLENVEQSNLAALGKIKVSLNQFEFDDCFDGSLQKKVIRWVPGKKVPEVPSESEKKLSRKTIDGEVIPQNLVEKCQTKHRERSPPLKLSLKQRQHIFENIDTYGRLCGALSYGAVLVEASSAFVNSDVTMPSPLRTHRAQFYDYPTISYFQENLKKAEETCAQEKPVSPAQPKLLYIRDGRLLSRSPSFLHKPSHVKKSREILSLTKVSVPRKAIKKYPIFSHCKSSIRQKKLSNIQMQPISSTEENSEASSRASLHSASRLHIESTKDRSRQALHLSKQPKGTQNPSRFLVNNRGGAHCLDSLPCIVCGVSRDNGTHSEYCPFVQPTSPPPLFSKHSNISLPELQALRSATSSTRIFNSSRGNLSVCHSYSAPSSPSNYPSCDAMNPQSCDAMNVDKDIIERTYHKYQSLSPFKTPVGSSVCLHDASKQMLPIKSSKNTSMRLVLHESRQNMNQFLPGDEQPIGVSNVSYITRSLSPTLGSFARQQKQPPANSVPSEMKISQVQLNPLPGKSSIDYVKLKKDSKDIREFSENASVIEAPPPTPIATSMNNLTPNTSQESVHNQKNIVPKASFIKSGEKEILVRLHEVYGESFEGSDCSENELASVSKGNSLAESYKQFDSSNPETSVKAIDGFCNDISHVSIDSIDSSELVKIRAQISEIDAVTDDLRSNTDSISQHSCSRQASFHSELTEMKTARAGGMLSDVESATSNVTDSVKTEGKTNEEFRAENGFFEDIRAENETAQEFGAENKTSEEIGTETGTFKEIGAENETSERIESENRTFDAQYDDIDIHDDVVNGDVDDDDDDIGISLAPLPHQDFTQGVDFNLDLDEEILRAMRGEEIDIDDFINRDM